MELYSVEMRESRWSFVMPICHRGCKFAFIVDLVLSDLLTYLLS